MGCRRCPGLFAALRGLIDRRRRENHRTGQFLLLGSASNRLLSQCAESLAGRVSYHELTPFSLEEAESSAVSRLWLRGGFPESFLAASGRASLTWREEFIRTYLQRDVPAFGLRIPAETLRRFWTMLAHGQGNPLNAARLAGGLGISGQSVARYLDLLADLDAGEAPSSLAWERGETPGQITKGLYSRLRLGPCAPRTGGD